MPNLVVVYDEGSANPMEIHTGLSRLGDVTFGPRYEPLHDD